MNQAIHVLNNPLERYGYFQSSEINSGPDFLTELGASEDYLDIIGGESWDSEPTESTPWHFMPFISQLETFPVDTESSNAM